jgi:hypothetical protein
MKSIRSTVTCSPGTRYAPETDTLWLALSNATISCTTTATTVTVSLQAIGSVRVAVFLQEKMVMDFVCTDETKTISIPCPSESAQQIQICKLSEPHYGILGVSALTCDGGTCSPLPPAPHHLAFIGDSITCGYGQPRGCLFHCNGTRCKKLCCPDCKTAACRCTYSLLQWVWRLQRLSREILQK